VLLKEAVSHEKSSNVIVSALNSLGFSLEVGMTSGTMPASGDSSKSANQCIHGALEKVIVARGLCIFCGQQISDTLLQDTGTLATVSCLRAITAVAMAK
jgi:hypothetical protein